MEMEMVLQKMGGRPGPREVEEQAAAEGDEELRRGPWTVDEDVTLINYIADHGEGRWNALARAAGLKRTGKSCRLRWLNYLRPDVKRGEFTADEQLLILDLHSRWGNRWSKIAAQLPGRTDNEIKNYWRTRVQKHAKQLNCDVDSQRFRDAMTFLWMPRLAAAPPQALAAASSTSTTTTSSSSSSSDDKTAAAVLGGEVDWAAMQGADHDDLIWSSMHEEDLPDLSAWVQGFSFSDALWSLDDIWRMH